MIQHACGYSPAASSLTVTIDAGTQAGDDVFVGLLYELPFGGPNGVTVLDDRGDPYASGTGTCYANSQMTAYDCAEPFWAQDIDAGARAFTATNGMSGLPLGMFVATVRGALGGVGASNGVTGVTTVSVTTPQSLDAGSVAFAAAYAVNDSIFSVAAPFKALDTCNGMMSAQMNPSSGFPTATFSSGGLGKKVALMVGFSVGTGSSSDAGFASDGGAPIDAGSSSDGGFAIDGGSAGDGGGLGSSSDGGPGASDAGSRLTAPAARFDVGCGCSGGIEASGPVLLCWIVGSRRRRPAPSSPAPARRRR